MLHVSCVCCDAVLILVLLVCTCFFFFQAEDGIRDLVRSRGLGDVYKRQYLDRPDAAPAGIRLQPTTAEALAATVAADDGPISVSYTHLTLPTSDLV